MQLTKQDVASIVGVIKANYDNAYRNSTKETLLAMIEQWYKSLVIYDKEIVGVAVKRVLESSEYVPTLAHIIREIKEIKAATEPTETELWERLVKVLGKVDDCVYRFRFNAIQSNGMTQGQNARLEFEKIWDDLPQVLKEYCSNENGLINLSRLTYDELSFEKGRFLKILPTLKTRLEIKQTINPDILQLASGTVKELSGSVEFLTLKDTKS